MSNKEGEEWEYASYHNDGDSNYASEHIEPALLYQPLGEDTTIGDGE